MSSRGGQPARICNALFRPSSCNALTTCLTDHAVIAVTNAGSQTPRAHRFAMTSPDDMWCRQWLAMLSHGTCTAACQARSCEIWWMQSCLIAPSSGAAVLSSKPYGPAVLVGQRCRTACCMGCINQCSIKTRTIAAGVGAELQCKLGLRFQSSSMLLSLGCTCLHQQGGACKTG